MFLRDFRYIFTAMELDNTTNLSCIKILIRLARTSEETAHKIISHSSLIKNLIRQFEKGGMSVDRKSSDMIMMFVFYLCFDGIAFNS